LLEKAKRPHVRDIDHHRAALVTIAQVRDDAVGTGISADHHTVVTVDP
jgi:hypothetical protein